jgi:hypothetical protein
MKKLIFLLGFIFLVSNAFADFEIVNEVNGTTIFKVNSSTSEIIGGGGAQGPPGTNGTGIVSGLIVFIRSGSCPAGYTEQTDMAGYMLLATNTTNGNVNTTGGCSTIVATGNISVPTFTGDSATLTGNVTNATLTITAFTPTGNVSSTALTMNNVTTSAASAGAGKTGNITNTTTLATHTHTIIPTGNLTNASLTMQQVSPTGNLTNRSLTITAYTPTGNVSQPTFTGSAVNNTPTYIKVICCMKD